MTEYEKLSLVLLMKIAEGLNLQVNRPATGLGVPERYFEEWKKSRDQWNNELQSLQSAVMRAVKPQ